MERKIHGCRVVKLAECNSILQYIRKLSNDVPGTRGIVYVHQHCTIYSPFFKPLTQNGICWTTFMFNYAYVYAGNLPDRLIAQQFVHLESFF
jgi:hypothetical protein